MYNPYIKRLIDIILSLFALIFLSPIIIIAAIAVKLTSKGSVLFKQKRVGKNKTHFQMLKFRTMRTDAPKDTPTHLLQNPYAYITPIGRFLRKTSLDELPQLINILKGDMSVIGPRPALWNQYDLIEARDQNNANTIRPGLTGLAQISGRDELPILIKANYDGEYTKKIGFLYDIKILFRTVLYVLKAKSVKEGGNNIN